MAIACYQGSLPLFGVSLLLIIVSPVEASAQAVANSFEELQGRVKAGDTVFVIESSGEETRGRIVMLSDASLELILDETHRVFAENAVKRIDHRRRDSVRNGLPDGDTHARHLRQVASDRGEKLFLGAVFEREGDVQLCSVHSLGVLVELRSTGAASRGPDLGVG